MDVLFYAGLGLQAEIPAYRMLMKQELARSEAASSASLGFKHVEAR